MEIRGWGPPVSMENISGMMALLGTMKTGAGEKETGAATASTSACFLVSVVTILQINGQMVSAAPNHGSLVFVKKVLDQIIGTTDF